MKRTAAGLCVAALTLAGFPASAEPDQFGLTCDVTVTMTNQPRPDYTPPPPEVLKDVMDIVVWVKDGSWCYREGCRRQPIVEVTAEELVLVRGPKSSLTVSQAEIVLRGRWEIIEGKGHAIATIEGPCRKVSVERAPG